MEVQDYAHGQNFRGSGTIHGAGVWCACGMDRSLGGDAAMTPDEEYKERIKKAIAEYLRIHEATGPKKLAIGYFEKRRER